jgi:hypothetical protein
MVLAAGLALASSPKHAEAASLTSTPVADAYVRSDAPTTNFGASTALTARGWSYQIRRSYLRFGVDLPAGQVVTKATMRVYSTTTGSSAGVDLRSVGDNTWGEGTLNYRNAPLPASTVAARAAYYGSGTYVSFDVTSLVKGSGPISVALTTLSTQSHGFASREDWTHRPQLVVETAATQPSGSVLFGVTAEGVPWDLSQLDAFQAAAGKRPSLVMWYQDFAHFPDFDPNLPQRILDRGALPMLTWEPWDYTGGTVQPTYALGRIIDGTHDAQIQRWASEIAAWNRPLFLRFAHEMNGSWNSWSEGVNGNQPGQYVTAWRHVREIFRRAGASNVTWVWSPNVVYSNSPPLAPFYPGDYYVDRVALDGYNWGNYYSYWQAWLSFEEIFGPGIAQLRALTAKPVMVGEVASIEFGGDKAAWIQDMFTALKNHPEIVSFTWFNHNKETDWRIQSSARAQTAFAAGISDPRYITPAS